MKPYKNGNICLERWVWEVRDCKTVNQSSSSFLIDCSWSGDDQQQDTVFIFEVRAYMIGC